jgi:phenylalanine-4-hydroxylase
MKPEVKKIAYTLDAVNYPFDITKEQPQLFVTPTFQNLIEVLEAFADTMAFRKGGAESVLKAIECKNPCTAVFSSGLQLSGVFTDVGMDQENQTTFIKTTGPSALAFNNKELEGHGKSYHSEGYSSPIGNLKGSIKVLENYTDADLVTAGIVKNEYCELFFENGFYLQGTAENWLHKEDKLLLIRFSNCTLSDSKGNLYYKPEWGNFDIAVGEKIVSVYNGAADKDAFEEHALVSNTNTHHPNYNELTLAYHRLFKQVRTCREQDKGYEVLPQIWANLQTNHREDWLCSLEILELLEINGLNATLAIEIRTYLENKASAEPEYSKLIHDGLYIIKHPVSQLN